jgi:hypothetical protein
MGLSTGYPQAEILPFYGMAGCFFAQCIYNVIEYREKMPVMPAIVRKKQRRDGKKGEGSLAWQGVGMEWRGGRAPKSPPTSPLWITCG